jgi:hypothetical protein
MLGSEEAEKDAMRLARSIRTFAGDLCFNPIWMFSQRNEDELAESTRQEIFSLGIRLITFENDSLASDIFFADYVTAAGLAESLAMGETSSLVMMASDTLVLRPPAGLLLPAGKSFGACPVHLKLLGSGYDDPIDEIWRLIYHFCRVDTGNIFPMQTIVDEQLVRAYFNAGILVVRPERGLLRAWQANFNSLCHLPEFEAFYQQGELFEIFMHQMLLAGSVLSLLKPHEFQLFPNEFNYPLHLHARVRAALRPTNLGQLCTIRYEDFSEIFSDPQLNNLIHIDPFMKNWLMDQA